ncbi:MAG: NADAR family protein [Erysipelotrichia bacterium]|nr:NADAR family protein [Erysipelotrichia bacterium]
MKVIAFNKPLEENGYLAINYLSDFYLHGIKFISVEQYFYYQKASTFKDEYRCQKILEKNNSRDFIEIAKDIVNYDDKIWSGRKQIVLYQGNLAKFKQNSELAEKLLESGDAVIALCNKIDKINGIGYNREDSRIYKTKNWLGTNLQGFSLMEVRRTLKEEIIWKKD